MATVQNCVPTVTLSYQDAASTYGVNPLVQVRLPLVGAPPSWGTGTGSLQVNKRFTGIYTLSATSVTLDLTTISTGSFVEWGGDTTFSTVKILYIENQAAVTNNYPLIIGNAASTSWQGPLSASATFSLPAMGTTGSPLLWVNGLAAGWSCATNKNLKLDSGANTITFAITILGN